MWWFFFFSIRVDSSLFFSVYVLGLAELGFVHMTKGEAIFLASRAFFSADGGNNNGTAVKKGSCLAEIYEKQTKEA